MGTTWAVGCRSLLVEDAAGPAIPAWWLYPTRAAARSEHFGPYALDVAHNAPIEGRGWPLVAISHGNSGSPWVHRELAAHLVRAGFVVALLEHPGNSRSDNCLAGTAANLENRPRQLKRVIDAAFAEPVLREHLRPDAVAVVGHSIGGYTALALAGGRATAFAHETPDGRPRPVATPADARIKALVLLAPATPWFIAEGALAAVIAPMLMLTAEHDAHSPAWHADIVSRGVSDPARVEHRVIAGAGHFSFQSPFPAAMCRSDFAPSQDPPGFDRLAFEPVMAAQIAAFMAQHLR